MSIIESEYRDVVDLFNQNEKTFIKRKEKMKKISFSKINWSDSYLDFTIYDSIINQLEKAKIFSEEKLDSIKNHFFDNKLVYCYKNKNENWGSIFIDYFTDYKVWHLFVENDDDEMILQQLKIAYHKNNRITKKVFYLRDVDADEETFMIDFFNYGKDNQLEYIVRNGFYEEKSITLPERKLIFDYDNEKVKIYSEQKINTEVKKHLIYNGKTLDRS